MRGAKLVFMKVLSDQIREFVDQAVLLWNRYLEVGPGKLGQADFDPVDAALQRVNESFSKSSQVNDRQDELRAAIDDLAELLRRCVERTEGLSFVTGEAGLIPRKDLHQRCDNAISTLRSFGAD